MSAPCTYPECFIVPAPPRRCVMCDETFCDFHLRGFLSVRTTLHRRSKNDDGFESVPFCCDNAADAETGEARGWLCKECLLIVEWTNRDAEVEPERRDVLNAMIEHYKGIWAERALLKGS